MDLEFPLAGLVGSEQLEEFGRAAHAAWSNHLATSIEDLNARLICLDLIMSFTGKALKTDCSYLPTN